MTTSTLADVPSDMASRPFPLESPRSHPAQALTKAELDGVLRALEIPFDLNLVRWRVTEWSEDGTRGLMMPLCRPEGVQRSAQLLVYSCWLDAQVHGTSQRTGSAQ
jgi:hypothetical protein